MKITQECMTPADSWMLVLCVVLPVASVAGILVWAAWTYWVDGKGKR